MMTASWKETHLPTILSRYDLQDIFNADEFGLFYQMLPTNTYHAKGEQCAGGKRSKVRLTGIAAANALGEKLPMFVIGKSVTPRCFKGVKSLPCQYKAQKKAWMDSEIFTAYVKKLDAKFETEGRKIVLIIDNCPAHPVVTGLKAVISFSTTKYNIQDPAHRSRCNQSIEGILPVKSCETSNKVH